MRLAVLAALIGVVLSAMTTPAAAQWRPYISHPLGFAFAAPGAMKLEKGTYNSPISGQHNTIVYAFAEDNIEYKVVVVDMRDTPTSSRRCWARRSSSIRTRRKC